MALAQLLDVFARETEGQIREILAAGDADAARITADGARERGRRVTAAAAQSTAERRARADAEVAAALRTARAQVLHARAAMLARVRAAVEAELGALLAADPRLGAALVADAIACAGGEPGVVRCTPALADAARAAAPAQLRVEADPAIATGAIVELASGTRIDATLARLLAREWPRLACEALERVS
ncbi:MAG: hypothetical protein ACM31C_28385 [Acidobacteriota bacterium]